MGNYEWILGPYVSMINNKTSGVLTASYPYVFVPLSRTVSVNANNRQSERWPYRNLVPGSGASVATGGTVSWDMLAYPKYTVTDDATLKQAFYDIPSYFAPSVGIPGGLGGTVDPEYYQRTSPGSTTFAIARGTEPSETYYSGVPFFSDMSYQNRTFRLTMELEVMPWQFKQVSYSFNYASVGAMTSWSYNTSLARGTYNLPQAYYYGLPLGPGPAWDWTCRYDDASNSGTGTVIIAVGGAVLSTYQPALGTYSTYTGYGTVAAGRIVGAWENQTYRGTYMPLTDGKIRLGSWPNAYHQTQADDVPTFWTSPEYLDFVPTASTLAGPRQLPLYVGITDDSGPNTGAVTVTYRYKQGIYL